MTRYNNTFLSFLQRCLAVHLLAILLLQPQTLHAATGTREFKIEKNPSWVNLVAFDPKASTETDKQKGGVSYLLVDEQVFLNGDQRESFRHYAFKIQNESGLESSANIEIWFDPSYQTLHLHTIDVFRGEQVISKLSAASVKILQREKSLDHLVFDGSKTANIFLEDVRVGDVIEYSYTLKGSNPVFAGKQSGQFDLQWGTPVQTRYTRLLTDPSHNVSITYEGGQQQADRQNLGNLQELVWRGADVSAIKFRDDVPKWFNSQPNIQWSDFQNWNAVARWAVPLYKVPDTLPADLLREVERIKSTQMVRGEQAMEALRFVQKTVRYMGIEVGPGSHAPNSPAVVLARRYGDCKDKTLLLLTLLKALKIEAFPALVNTKKGRGILNAQPSPYAFNHVIVHAVIDGVEYWLDPTMQPQMGALNDIYQGNHGYALVIRQNQIDLTEMKYGPATSYVSKVIAVYDTSAGWGKPVNLTVTTFMEGRSAERFRSKLALESVETIQKQLANYYAKYYPEIGVVQTYNRYDKSSSNQIILTEYYTLANFWKKVGDDKVEAYFAAPEVYDYLRNPQNTFREEPLGLSHPVDVMQTMYILTPDTWKLKGGTSVVQDTSFNFESSVTFAPGKIIEMDSYRSLKDAVEAKDIQVYLANIGKARKLTGYTITRSTKGDD